MTKLYMILIMAIISSFRLGHAASDAEIAKLDFLVTFNPAAAPCHILIRDLAGEIRLEESRCTTPPTSSLAVSLSPSLADPKSPYGNAKDANGESVLLVNLKPYVVKTFQKYNITEGTKGKLRFTNTIPTLDPNTGNVTGASVILFPRYEIDGIQNLLDSRKLIVIDVIKARDMLADINRKEEAQKQQIEQRAKIEDQIKKLDVNTMKMFTAMFFEVPTKNNVDKIVPQVCAISANVEMANLTAGYRYLSDFSEMALVERSDKFDYVANDLKELYPLIQQQRCQRVILPAADANKLIVVLSRDNISYAFSSIKSIDELMVSYALSLGYQSIGQYEFAKSIKSEFHPDSVKKLWDSGIKTKTEYGNLVDKMTASGYSSERSLKNAVLFKADEEEGRKNNKSAFVVKQERDQKLMQEQKIIAVQNAREARARENERKSSEGRSGDGLTRGEWVSRCVRYTSARGECAVSASLGSCIETKIGQMDAVMAQTYCNGSVPNWSLMGMRP